MRESSLRSRLAAAYPSNRFAAAASARQRGGSLQQRVIILLFTGGLYLITKAIYDPLAALPLVQLESAATNIIQQHNLALVGEPSNQWCQLLVSVARIISKLTRLSNAALTVVSCLVALDAYALISNTIDDALYDYMHSKTAETGIIDTLSWTLAGYTFTAVDLFWDVIGFVSAVFLRRVPWPFEAHRIFPFTIQATVYSFGCCLHICCWLLLLKQLYLRLLPLLFSQAMLTAQQVTAVMLSEISALLQYSYYEQPFYGSLAIVFLLNVATVVHVLWF